MYTWLVCDHCCLFLLHKSVQATTPGLGRRHRVNDWLQLQDQEKSNQCSGPAYIINKPNTIFIVHWIHYPSLQPSASWTHLFGYFLATVVHTHSLVLPVQTPIKYLHWTIRLTLTAIQYLPIWLFGNLYCHQMLPSTIKYTAGLQHSTVMVPQNLSYLWYVIDERTIIKLY